MNTIGTMRINERKWPVKLFAVLAVVAIAATAILAQLGGTLAAPADKVVTLQCESGVSQDFHVEKGETKTLGISYLSDARSTDTNIATVAFTAAVDGEAGITGVKAGIASLIYGNIAGKVGAFRFQITDSENISGYTLKDGGEMSFDAQAGPGQGETKACPVVDVTGQASRIVWSSMNESVATVAANGDITSVGPGMTVVTGDFTDKWGVPRYVNIVVGVGGGSIEDPWVYIPEHIGIVEDSKSILVGETFRPGYIIWPLNTSSICPVWKSSNSAIATVNSIGMITGVSEGTTTVTATRATTPVQTDTIQITVMKAPIPSTGINIVEESKTIEIGYVFSPTVILSPANTTDLITWTSSNPAIAEVDQNTGLIYGKAQGGPVIITASLGSAPAYTDSIKITINPNSGFAVKSILVSPPGNLAYVPQLDAGATLKFSALVRGVGAVPQDVKWEVSGNNSAGTKIDSNGLLTAALDESVENLIVKATSIADNAVSGWTYVIVQYPQSGIEVEPLGPIELRPGGSQEFTATLQATGGHAFVSWRIIGSQSSGTKIGIDGILQVAEDEPEGEFTVRAVYLIGPGGTLKEGATVDVTVRIKIE